MMKMSMYLAEDCVRLVVGDMKRRLHIHKCENYQLHAGTLINNVITDEDEVRKVLIKVSHDYAAYANRVNLILTSSKIITKVLQVPVLPRRALLELTKRELEGFADPEADMVYDYGTIACRNATNDGGTILCAAVERSVIREYTELFADCGLRVKTIDTALNAAAQLLTAMPEFAGKTYIFSVLDGRNMMSILYTGGDYTYTSRIRLLSERASSEIWDEIEKELKSILLFQEARRSEYTLSDVFVSGITDQERREMIPRLAKNIGADIRFLNDTEAISVGSGCDFKLSDYIYTTGSLLRR